MTTTSNQNPTSDCSFPISIMPNENDFAAANMALFDGEMDYISSTYFQHYIALIATCIQRGHRTMAEIMAYVAPLVGAENAVHVPWLIEILSGPASDVHLWDSDGPERGGYFYGPGFELKEVLERAASARD